MRKYPVIFLMLLIFQGAYAAQIQPDSLKTDTVSGVIIRAYEQNSKLLETPAAVNVINQQNLERYSNTSILPALDATPGVQMEERSPGSYLMNIRGSSLRAPFGVRNVQVYYNGIPYTDPSGDTYLNQLGYYNFESLEIIKGPGSSLYGAGTGGVILINSMPEIWQPGVTINYTGGSYNLHSIEAELRIGDSIYRNVIRYQALTDSGYRTQTQLKRQVASWDAVLAHNSNSELSADFLYGNLTYQTPGGLTLKEFEANPRAARPATGSLPSAVAAKATVYQQTFLSGFTYKYEFNSHWENTTTLYGDYTQMFNPTIRNYSATIDPNYGGRTSFKYHAEVGQAKIQWVTGAQVQQDFALDRTYDNNKGNPDTMRIQQQVNNYGDYGFTQLTCQASHWIFTGGVSLNELNVNVQTLVPLPLADQIRNYNNQFAPRIAVLNEITDHISVYAAIEKGFSPPSLSELVPTGSNVNLGLNPEQGINYEIGSRGYALDNRLNYDINVFYFLVQDAIVENRDSTGATFYNNAGGTNQKGIEAYAGYRLINGLNRYIGPVNIWASYTGYDFKYSDYNKLGENFSGDKLQGVSPNTLAAGLDIRSRTGMYLNLTYKYCDAIPLNDANTAFASHYNLVGGRLGFKKNFRKFAINIYAGVDNALNQAYSLGDDINAANGRYYNPAAGINYYAGLSLGYL